ncbi:wax ester/triacylglycerol synthase domain-containing protein [Spirillospora sp. NPDC050679]
MRTSLSSGGEVLDLSGPPYAAAVTSRTDGTADELADPVPVHRLDQVVLKVAEAAPEDCYWHIGTATRLPGPAPAPAEMHQRLAAAAVAVPALTYRLTGPLRRARWRPDPCFRPEQHLDYHRVPAGTPVAEAVMSAIRAPLPRDRPLWSVLIVHGHSDGEHLLCYRTHHAFQDGISMTRTVQCLFSGKALRPPAVRPTSSLRQLASGARLLPELLRLSVPVKPWMPQAGRTASAPSTAASAGGPERQIHTTRLDLAVLRQIAAATDASLVQVQLAVLAGAIRAWAPERWNPSGRLRRRRGLTVSLPVSQHDSRQETALGNHLGLLPVTLPCAEPDPLLRLQAVIPQTGMDKIARIRARMLTNRLPYLPMRAALPVVRRIARNQLGVTMLRCDRGLPADALGTFLIPPLASGLPAMVAFLRTDTAVAITVVARPDAHDVHRLPALLGQALTELHARVGESRI